MRSMRVKTGLAIATAGLVALMLTVMATTGGAAGPVGSGTASAKKSICGKGTGKKAKGAPIKLAGTMTLIPGVDFTTIGKIAQAYFKCVNDNGGINGRPISYTFLGEQLDPAQQLSLAKKFVEATRSSGSWATRASPSAVTRTSTTGARATTSSAPACRASASAPRTSPL